MKSLITQFFKTVDSVAVNWTEGRRRKFQKETLEVRGRLRKEENAQGDDFNDDRLALARQDFFDYMVSFNIEVDAHNKESGLV